MITLSRQTRRMITFVGMVFIITYATWEFIQQGEPWYRILFFILLAPLGFLFFRMRAVVHFVFDAIEILKKHAK